MAVYPLFGVYRSESTEQKALEVMRSGQIASGEYVERFRSEFGALIGNPNVVTTNDMSSAIQIALHVAGVRQGDEVLTASFACLSTNAPIGTSGATPVWVDVEAGTGLISPDDFRAAITPRTRAAVVYHFAGYPARIEEIADICRRHEIALIEDCDNALLARAGGRAAGSFGDFAVYSFYPNRQINAMEGGALACRREKDAERAQCLRRYGIDQNRFRDEIGEISETCDVAELGWAAALNNLCSAIGHTQLGTVIDRIEANRRSARCLQEALADTALSFIRPYDGCEPSYWVLLARVTRRDDVLRALKAKGVHASRVHFPTHRYSGFKAVQRPLPGTDDFMRTVVALPCGWWLTDDDVDAMASAIRSTLEDLAVEPMIECS